MKKKVNSRIQKFYSIIDAASLRNPTILNDLNSVKVTVQHEPESSSNPYHFIFILRIDDDQIENIISKIQYEMMESWYAFFWSDSTLYIVFNSKKFQISLPDGWSSETYKAAQAFGKTQNIGEAYLDFKKYFLQSYQQI